MKIRKIENFDNLYADTGQITNDNAEEAREIVAKFRTQINWVTAHVMEKFEMPKRKRPDVEQIATRFVLVYAGLINDGWATGRLEHWAEIAHRNDGGKALLATQLRKDVSRYVDRKKWNVEHKSLDQMTEDKGDSAYQYVCRQETGDVPGETFNVPAPPEPSHAGFEDRLIDKWEKEEFYARYPTLCANRLDKVSIKTLAAEYGVSQPTIKRRISADKCRFLRDKLTENGIYTNETYTLAELEMIFKIFLRK